MSRLDKQLLAFVFLVVLAIAWTVYRGYETHWECCDDSIGTGAATGGAQ